MAKITITETYMEVEREDGDPKKFRDGWDGMQDAESAFLYWLKKQLNAEPHNMGLIKKRMWKDGHMVDELQQYLRTGKIRVGKPYLMIFNDHWAINGLDEDWNENGKATLSIVRGVGEHELLDEDYSDSVCRA